MKKAFINATIYPVEGSMIVKGTLLIDENKIIALGSDIDTQGADLIDCQGLSITPGFVDPHTHSGIWGEGAGPYPGDNDGNEISSAITPYVRTLDAIHPEDYDFADARMGGVTTMGVMHGSANPIGGQLCVLKSYGTEVDDMLIRELAGVKMALGENPKRVGYNLKRAPNTRMGVAHLIRKAFYEAIEYDQEMEQYRKLVKREEKKELEDRKPIKKPIRDLGKEILV
ncbi:MAG: amidohydrolase, partial [Candidatus Heimdallarchaeota archaeon]|nr:amidohydrolase [Candidatus Heimdallarchaeota archaeon]